MSAATSPPQTCPCCGDALPLGLFAHEPRAMLPKAVLDMNAVGHPVDGFYAETVIAAAGRWFVQCHAKLPLDWDESPLSVGTWVEVDRVVARRVIRVVTGEDTHVDFSGVLACDLPGFTGTIGAKVAVHHDPSAADPRPRIRRCADERVTRTRGHGGHDGLVAMYRRCWNDGRDLDVVAAHAQLRHAVAARWRELVERPTFRHPIAPPPRLAGIQPAEFVVAPPLDTGGEVVLATVGNAEANPAKATELVAFARDVRPQDDFASCFGEFAYWSRATSAPLSRGSIIAENHVIPQTSGMTAWLLWDPWWQESWQRPARAEFEDVEVRLLAAIAVHPQERQFAAQNGARRLVDTFELADADVSDLQRPSVVT